MASRTSHPVHDAKNEGKRRARQAANSPVVSALTRLGYAARGIIYGLIGVLAIEAAVGSSNGRFTNQQGVIGTLDSQPIGHFLLIIVTIGLFGYALWGFIRAILDPLGKGSDTSGVVTRIGYAISGISYALLGIAALNTVARKPVIAVTGGGGGNPQGTVANLMDKSWGPWLIGAVGIAIVVAAVIQIKQGYEANFDLRFNSYSMSAEQRKWAIRSGRFGYMARGVVFAIIGLFLFQAALFHNPALAKGFDGALVVLSQQSYGTILLAVIAAGLIAFGIYSLMGSMWFRLKKA